MLAQRGPSEAVLHFKALDKLGRDGDNLLPGATELGKKRKGGVEEGGGGTSGLPPEPGLGLVPAPHLFVACQLRRHELLHAGANDGKIGLGNGGTAEERVSLAPSLGAFLPPWPSLGG